MRANILLSLLHEMDTEMENINILIQIGDSIVDPVVIKEVKHDGNVFIVLTDADVTEDEQVSLEIEKMTSGKDFIKIDEKDGI